MPELIPSLLPQLAFAAVAIALVATKNYPAAACSALCAIVVALNMIISHLYRIEQAIKK